MTGPGTVLEGPLGFYRAHLSEDEFDLSCVTDGLGRRWETENISYKLYPCCHYLGAYIDCAREIRRKHGLRPMDVDSFECVVAPGQVALVVEPLEAKMSPRTGYEAKFSLPYAVAAALTGKECGLADFEEEAIRDEGVAELARRFRHTVAETGYPQVFPGWLRVTTRDGSVLEHREPVHRGGPGNPVTPEDIVAKFSGNAVLALPPERAENLRAAIMSLGSQADVGTLAGLLAFTPPAGGLSGRRRAWES
jgi:2-methylcitrate dehydratase PrpD